jgi:hypothetical protein
MSTGGILVRGHEFHAHGLRFSGGAPSGWCLELVDSNECCLREIAAGTGGGNDDLLANGIHLYGSTANPTVNYGDSLIEEVSIKLKSPGTTGILIEHQGDPQGTSYYVVNNVLLNRVQVNSASVPQGASASGSGGSSAPRWSTSTSSSSTPPTRSRAWRRAATRAARGTSAS